MLAAWWATGCSNPETAGNATWDFVGAAQTGGPSKAYGMLCDEVKGTTSARDFDDSRLAEFAPPLRLETLVGVDYDIHEDLATQGSDVKTSTRTIEGSWGSVTEVWRVSLVKEHGAWKVCAFDKMSERPRSAATPSSIG